MRKDRQTDMTKVIVAFRSFANVPENDYSLQGCTAMCVSKCVPNFGEKRCQHAECKRASITGWRRVIFLYEVNSNSASNQTVLLLSSQVLNTQAD